MALSTRFYPNQKDYIEQLNLMDDAITAGGGGGGGGTEFVTSSFRVKDTTDQTKKAAFDASGISSGTTRTFTLPNVSMTFAGLGVTQTFTAVQTVSLANAVPLVVQRTGSATDASTGYTTTSGTLYVGHGAANTFAVGGSSTLSSSPWFSVSSAAATAAGTFAVGSYFYRSIATGISAAGSTQGTATALTKDINVVSTVASNTGVKLPTAVAGMQITVINTGANALNVYPDTGGTIEGLSANTAYTVATGERRVFVASSSTQWYVQTSGSGGGSGDMLLGTAQSVTGAKTFADSTLLLAGSTSGTGTLKAPAAASSYVWTMPSVSTTLLGTGDVINDVTTGGTTKALSAQQGVNLKGLIDNAVADPKLRTGSGAPSNALGQNAESYMRTDKPFLGALYIKTSGSWALADNSYTISTLPTASAAYAGAVATVTDSVYCPVGQDFQCVSYDGGTTYYWRPVDKSWTFYRGIDKDTASAGTGSAVTSFTVTTPNRSDFFPPNFVDLYVSIEGQATGNAGTRTFDISAPTMSGGSSSLLTQVNVNTPTAGLSFWAQNVIHITAANAGFSHPFSAYTSNLSSAANSTYSGANWHNLTINFRKTASSASDTVQTSARKLVLIYQ